MADNKEKQASCPICGYTDSAMDADALEDAMAEHMRMTHNQVMPVDKGNSDMKLTGRDDTMEGVPIVAAPGAPAGQNIVSPGNIIENDRDL